MTATPLVSWASIGFMAISCILAIGVPIAIFIWLKVKRGVKFVPMLVGAAGFVLFALVLESFVHRLVLVRDASGAFELAKTPVLYMLYGGFMAGIFEETARFVSFKLLKKKYQGLNTALSYGIGHGGIESILLAGLAMISNIVLSVMINAGGTGAILGSLSGATLVQTEAAVNSLINTNPFVFLMSGIERLIAITIHMSLSVLVWHAAMDKRRLWLFPTAITLHAVVNFAAALYQTGAITSIYLVEIITLVAALAVLVFTVFTHRKIIEESRLQWQDEK